MLYIILLVFFLLFLIQAFRTFKIACVAFISVREYCHRVFYQDMWTVPPLYYIHETESRRLKVAAAAIPERGYYTYSVMTVLLRVEEQGSV